MAGRDRYRFGCGGPDFSGVAERAARVSYEEANRRVVRSDINYWRQYIANVKAHPEKSIAWDMPCTPDEFLRIMEEGGFQ